jgi:ADP-ribose pyrophosphatase YjhB (NUDIX family)
VGVFGGLPFRHTYPNRDVLESTVVVFECRIVGGHLEARDGEAAELRFFAPSEMPPLVLPYPAALFEVRSGEVLFQWDDTWLDLGD